MIYMKYLQIYESQASCIFQCYLIHQYADQMTEDKSWHSA